MIKFSPLYRKLYILKERMIYTYQSYNGDKHKLISDTEFTVIDVESTGLNSKTDKILSIGAVKIFNYEIDISNTFEVYIQQEFNDNSSVNIHGILKNGNLEKNSEAEALKKFIGYTGNSIIIGHNINFDISIINTALQNNNFDKLTNTSIDTVNIYKRVKSGGDKTDSTVSLDKVCEEFGIPLSDRHNAAGDAYITAILFLKLLKRLEYRGVQILKDLQKKSRII
jgi:DNA polymerase-3 subunit epsilon